MRNFVNNTFVFSLIWLKNKRNGPSPKANWSKKYKSKALRGSNLWAQLKPKCFTLLKILPWIKIIDWLKIQLATSTSTNKQQTTSNMHFTSHLLEVFFSLFSALFLFCKFDLLPAGRRIKYAKALNKKAPRHVFISWHFSASLPNYVCSQRRFSYIVAIVLIKNTLEMIIVTTPLWIYRSWNKNL